MENQVRDNVIALGSNQVELQTKYTQVVIRFCPKVVMRFLPKR